MHDGGWLSLQIVYCGPWSIPLLHSPIVIKIVTNGWPPAWTRVGNILHPLNAIVPKSVLHPLVLIGVWTEIMIDKSQIRVHRSELHPNIALGSTYFSSRLSPWNKKKHTRAVRSMKTNANVGKKKSVFTNIKVTCVHVDFIGWLFLYRNCPINIHC